VGPQPSQSAPLHQRPKCDIRSGQPDWWGAAPCHHPSSITNHAVMSSSDDRQTRLQTKMPDIHAENSRKYRSRSRIQPTGQRVGRLVFEDDVQSVDDAGDVAENGQEDVDAEIGTEAALKSNTERREDDGKEDLADVAAREGHFDEFVWR
jgi:hypothetical protein